MDTVQAAVRVARDSYGRLLAWLAWKWRDIAAAEDALGDAFALALERWPREGVPSSPEGWLMTTAKRKLLQGARRQRLADDPALTILWNEDPAEPAPSVPDDRLRLMFVCAHPAIDASVRSALMLQTVLGIDAIRMASAFVVKPGAMTKRLVRAKAKIKLAGIRFDEPGDDELPDRVHAVLEAIYAAYVLDDPREAAVQDAADGSLAIEALFLAELVAAHLPDSAEALGLVALLSFCESRKPARLDAAGDYVPLDRQDTRRWDHALMTKAYRYLAHAAAHASPGPFQYEAAIHAAHCHRATGNEVPWQDIVVLYRRLLAIAPTVGARIAYAMALAQAESDATLGLRELDAIDVDVVARHQPWWAALAHLQMRAGHASAAIEAFDRALALTVEPSQRRHLAAQAATLRRST